MNQHFRFPNEAFTGKQVPHDSAQNEAERTNAAIGEALTTGSPVAPPNDPLHGLPTAELERMCLKDIEQHCIAWEEANTWSIASQIAQRIHDESGPGKNDFLISLASYHPESHIQTPASSLEVPS